MSQGIQNPTDDWNPESKFHRQKLESSTWNPESAAWNPKSKTVLDSHIWGEIDVFVADLTDCCNREL